MTAPGRAMGAPIRLPSTETRGRPVRSSSSSWWAQVSRKVPSTSAVTGRRSYAWPSSSTITGVSLPGVPMRISRMVFLSASAVGGVGEGAREQWYVIVLRAGHLEDEVHLGKERRGALPRVVVAGGEIQPVGAG